MTCSNPSVVSFEENLAAKGGEPNESREAPRRVVILGATGSIGKQTADVILKHPSELRAIALAAYRNVSGVVDLSLIHI